MDKAPRKGRSMTNLKKCKQLAHRGLELRPRGSGKSEAVARPRKQQQTCPSWEGQFSIAMSQDHHMAVKA